jgi:hypothetical protein
MAYLSSANPAAGVEIFEHWVHEDWVYEQNHLRQEKLKKPLPFDPDPEKMRSAELMRENAISEEEAFKTSKRHLDTRLTNFQFARLREIKNVWVRALLYCHYPDDCPNDWVDAPLEDLKLVGQAPSRLDSLVALLDDDDFQVRENATNELLEGAGGYAPYLSEKLRRTLPPETARRLRLILEKTGKPELPALWRRTITHFGCNPGPQTRQMLLILKAQPYSELIRHAAWEVMPSDSHWQRFSAD